MGKPISFANREVCDLTICDYKTQAPVHVLDYANVTTQEITGEEVFAYGGHGHPKKVTFYGEKGGTLACEVQILTAELFSIMTGAAIETTAKFIKRLELTASAGALTIPVGTTFAENTINVYAASDDCGTPLEVTVSGQTITLPGGSTGSFIVYGIENINSGVKKMSIKSTTFPKAVTIYGETVMKGTDDALYPYKLIAYKATPQQNFSLGLSSSGDPTTLTITFDLLADGDNNLMDMILLEDEDGGPTLTSITITTPPSDVDYTAGETFSTVGMVVTATYSDGTTGVVTGYSFTPAIPLTANDETITISYTADGVTKTVTQAITVS